MTSFYTPLDVHKPFHGSSARYKAMVGGVGSGKSLTLCAEAIAFALEQPGSDMFMTRRFVPGLKDSTESIFFEVLPTSVRDAGTIRREGGHVSSFEFPNGSLIKFRGLDDWQKHKSANLSWIGFDEADEQTEANVVGMSTRLRQDKPLRAAADKGFSPPGRMRQQTCLASNPAGRNWIWKAFINEDTRWHNAEGFLSTTLDNPHLPRDYVLDLLSRPLPFVRRYVLCLFDEQAGAIYPDWSRESNIVHWEPPKDGESVELWHAMDPGTTRINPTSCGWYVVDRRRARLVQIAEYAEPDLPAASHAENWKRIEARLPGRVTWRTGDPQTLGARDRGSNMKLGDIYRRLGFSFAPGPVTHKVRIPALGELISTGRFVVTPACVTTADQISGYAWEDQLPQDMDLGEYRDVVKKAHDHLVDCAQYAAARWVVASTPNAPTSDKTPQQLWSDHVRATIRRSRDRNPAGAGEIF